MSLPLELPLLMAHAVVVAVHAIMVAVVEAVAAMCACLLVSSTEQRTAAASVDSASSLFHIDFLLGNKMWGR